MKMIAAIAVAMLMTACASSGEKAVDCYNDPGAVAAPECFQHYYGGGAGDTGEGEE